MICSRIILIELSTFYQICISEYQKNGIINVLSNSSEICMSESQENGISPENEAQKMLLVLKMFAHQILVNKASLQLKIPLKKMIFML